MAQENNSQQTDIKILFKCIPCKTFELEISKEIEILCNLYNVTVKEIMEKLMIRAVVDAAYGVTNPVALTTLIYIAKEAGFITR